MTDISNDGTIRAIATFFEERTGQQLGESRLWRIETVLRNVMKTHALADLRALLAAIERTPSGDVAAATIHSIMNHESSFFRDLNIFAMLENDILPHLNRTLSGNLLRIWCAGCSTGQEAYSLAIILKRQEQLWKNWRVSILGTDVSPFAVKTAQAGVYQQMDVQRGLPIADLLRWFEPVNDNWRIAPGLRSMTNFKTDNLLDPRALSGTFDLILCRNVLLYFSPELRSRALSRIARFARPDTVLLLGAGETTIGTSNLFVPSADFRGAYQPPAPASLQPALDRLAS